MQDNADPVVRSDRRPLAVDSTPAEPVVPLAMEAQYSDKWTHRLLTGEAAAAAAAEEEGVGATN